MRINNIGIIGGGFVGNALFQSLKKYFFVKVFDLDDTKKTHSYEQTLESQVIFICLPTPMKDANGSECNLSIIENFFKNIPENHNSIFVIKSTVPVGTTKKLQNNRKDLKIIHNPEFLTAANAVLDFQKSERHILGGNIEYCRVVEEILKKVTPFSKNIFVSCDESEAIKYFANTFLATKVAYFNMIYDLSVKFNLNYDNIVDGICSDSRIGYSHSKTPGPDGDRGFGGSCFPKDINALINTFKEKNLNFNILKEVWDYNKSIRTNWDWETNKSAVLK